MTTNETQTARSHHAAPADLEVIPAAAPAPPSGFAAGDPTTLGLPSFVVGSVALGLNLIGFAPGGAPLAILLAATSLGLLVAAIWSAALGQSAVAAIFGIFASFWFSYSVLVLGLTHSWFGIEAADVVNSVRLFQIAWLVIIATLTLATLRLPLAFTAVFALIDLALVLLLIGSNDQASASVEKVAGVVVLAFAAIGLYLFFNAATTATGGKALPIGSPLLKA